MSKDKLKEELAKAKRMFDQVPERRRAVLRNSMRGFVVQARVVSDPSTNSAAHSCESVVQIKESNTDGE